MKHIAFIGAGNMGGALVRGACKALDPQEVLIYEPSQKAAAALSAETGCQVAASGAQAVREARYVMLCVKPQVLEPVLEGLLPALREGAQAGEHRVVVSIAAGVQLEALDQMLARGGLELPVVRIMPNTPAAIGQGVLLIAPGPRVSGEDYAGLEQALGRCGLLERVTEQQLDQGSAISGCGPAFVYMFIEAMADACVRYGVPRAKALMYAEQTILGSAKLALESGRHPGQLKDDVCSPGGTTIEGVYALENAGFRAAVMDAVSAACKKTFDLGRKS